MDKSIANRFNADVAVTLKKYSGLQLQSVKDQKNLIGKYQVIDNLGVLQEEYDILISVPQYYPLGFPTLTEISKKIPREDDRHIDENGVACVEIHQKILLISRKGISLCDFIEKYVHRYFCWQLRYEAGDLENLEQWSHNDAGTVEFYTEAFKINNLETIKKILLALVENNLPNSYDACICGSNLKYKFCHEQPINNIKNIGADQFKLDYDCIKIYAK